MEAPIPAPLPVPLPPAPSAKPRVPVRKPKPKRRPKFIKIILTERPIEDPVVTRAQWGAKRSHKPLPKRKGAVSAIICTHTASESCDTEADCVGVVQALQETFIDEKGESDLPYNFMVGGDGRVYEGRGWKASAPFPQGFPDQYNDGKILSVAFIGEFGPESLVKPSENMVQARIDLVTYGEHKRFIQRDLPLLSFILGYI